MALAGPAQTNNRAELSAVLHALQSETRDAHIKTDSEYVLHGCLKHRFVWAACGWTRVQNVDLWKQVHELLEARGHQVVLSKVKGHAKLVDVASGRVTARDKHGNDAADKLASDAAKSHALPQHIVRAVQHRRHVTVAIQRMMIDVLAARMHRVAQHADDHSSSSCCSADCLHVSSTSSSESESAEPCSGMLVQSTLAIHSGSDQPT